MTPLLAIPSGLLTFLAFLVIVGFGVFAFFNLRGHIRKIEVPEEPRQEQR